MSDWSTVYQGSESGASRLTEKLAAHRFVFRVVGEDSQELPLDTRLDTPSAHVAVQVQSIESPERLDELHRVLESAMELQPPPALDRLQENAEAAWGCAFVLGLVFFILYVVIYCLGGNRDDVEELGRPIETALYTYSSELDVLDSGWLEELHPPFTMLLAKDDDRSLMVADAVRTLERVVDPGDACERTLISLAVLKLENEPWNRDVDELLGQVIGENQQAVVAVLRHAYGAGPAITAAETRLFRRALVSEHWIADTVLQRQAQRTGDESAAREARGRMAARARSTVLVACVSEWFMIFGVALGFVLLAIWMRSRPRENSIPLSVPWPMYAGLGAGMLAAACYLWFPRLLYHFEVLVWSESPVDYLYCLWGGIAALGLMPLLRSPGGPGLLEALGFKGRPLSILVFATLAGVALDQLSSMGFMLASAQVDTMQWGGIDESLIWGTPAVVLASAVNGIVFAALFEELIFRGLIYGSLRQRIGIWPAAVVSSILFTAMHGYASLGTLLLFVGGVVFAIIFERSRSLIPVILVHALWNFLVTIENMAI